MNNRLRVGVIFGGRSVEHEISVITALQLMRVVDVSRFEVTPVYISTTGKWYTGPQLRQREFYVGGNPKLGQLKEVTLIPGGRQKGLTILPKSRTDKLLAALDLQPSTIPIDLFVLAFHGEYGEDGCIQGLMELADLPYSSCGVLPSALSMNKYLCKSVLASHGIPVLPALRVFRHSFLSNPQEVLEEIDQEAALANYPLFVKPNNLGSSIGISRVLSREGLIPALTKVFTHDIEAIIEPCVTAITEINISIMEQYHTQNSAQSSAEPTRSNFQAQPTRVAVPSVVEIPFAAGGVLSYEEKYLKNPGAKKTGDGAQEGMANLARAIDPQNLSPAIKEQVTNMAITAFKVLQCSGVVRFDFIMDTDKNQIYFNELNPLPGSFAFYLWEKSHPALLYTEEVTHMIQSALARHSEKAALIKNVGFKALAR